jgi:hypothetical protein
MMTLKKIFLKSDFVNNFDYEEDKETNSLFIHIHLTLFKNFIHPFELELLEIIDNSKNTSQIPKSFEIILKHLISKILFILETSETEAEFIDFTTIFKPGLFMNAVLNQIRIILKDLQIFHLTFLNNLIN